MSTKTTRSTEEKLAIVLEGLKEQSNVSEICRKYGISQSLYYKWRDKFLEAGKESLSGSRSSRADKSVEAKIEELEKVIGRQTVVIEVLKKNLRLA
jgi:putative transposase